MLAKIAPRFVIQQVIQNGYSAEAMSIELLKQPFGNHESFFGTVDSKNFYEARFYGYISSLSEPNSFENKYERQAYSDACKKFQLFNEVNTIYEKINAFTSEVRTLYNYVERNNSSSNIFSQSEETNLEFEADVLDCIDRFQKLVDDLEAYPEWKDKVNEEVGSWFHLIHNNLAESESKRKIFLKMNRQEYFV